VSEEAEPVLALSSSLNRKSGMGKRVGQIAFNSENVHNNYFAAQNRNQMNLAVFSSAKVTFSFSSALLPVRVLDLIMFKDDKPNKAEAADHYTGLWFVTKVSRSAGAKQFTTLLEVCREGFSDTQGSFK